MRRRRVNTRLVTLRLAAGKSQCDIARDLGVHERAVQRWESGKHVPDAHRWPAYAKLLEISTHELTEAILEVIASTESNSVAQ